MVVLFLPGKEGGGLRLQTAGLAVGTQSGGHASTGRRRVDRGLTAGQESSHLSLDPLARGGVLHPGSHCIMNAGGGQVGILGSLAQLNLVDQLPELGRAGSLLAWGRAGGAGGRKLPFFIFEAAVFVQGSLPVIHPGEPGSSTFKHLLLILGECGDNFVHLEAVGQEPLQAPTAAHQAVVVPSHPDVATGVGFCESLLGADLGGGADVLMPPSGRGPCSAPRSVGPTC